MASSILLSEICAICQEEFTSPKSDLDLIRPESCASHWFHRRCLTEALSYRPACPLCGRECRTIVDQSDVKKKVVTEEPQESLETQDPRIVGSVEEALESLQDVIQGYCAGCNQIVSFHQFYANAPCYHMFHYHCLSTHWSPPGRRCVSCNQRVAAVIRYPQNCIVQFDSMFIAQPQFADLQSRLGLASAPAMASNPCPLCGEIGPGKPRVQPPSCPGSHIMHRECFVSRVDLTTIYTCPIENCNRQFLPKSLMNIPAAKDVKDCEDTETDGEISSELLPRERRISEQTPPSPILLFAFGRCCRCNNPVESNAVRPENCDHLFHRGCLVVVARKCRKCPVRGCKRKFRKIKNMEIPISDVGFLFPVENAPVSPTKEDKMPGNFLLYGFLTIVYTIYNLLKYTGDRIWSLIQT